MRGPLRFLDSRTGSMPRPVWASSSSSKSSVVEQKREGMRGTRSSLDIARGLRGSYEGRAATKIPELDCREEGDGLAADPARGDGWDGTGIASAARRSTAGDGVGGGARIG